MCSLSVCWDLDREGFPVKIQECRDRAEEARQDGNLDAGDRFEMAARCMEREDWLGAEVWMDKAQEALAAKGELVTALELV